MASKEITFIERGNTLDVPRPTSVNAGVVRDRWLEKVTGKKAFVTSPELWEKLIKVYPLRTLIKDDDKTEEE